MTAAVQAAATARADRLRRFAALMRKEGMQILRDPSSLLIAVVLPVLLLFLFGYALSLDADHTKVGVAVESSSPAARDLAASFQASRYFDARIGTDRRQFAEDLVTNRIKGIIVIPETFTAAAAQPGGAPQIQILVDGTDPNTANFVLAYAQGVLGSWQAMEAAGSGGSGLPAIDVQQRVWFNQELVSRNVLVPGAIAIVMTMIGTLLTALVVAREWERGTMEAMMATPVTALELLAGKILPYFLLGLASLTLCVVVTVFLFGVPFRGSVFALYLVSSAFLCPALGLGLVISAATKNQFLASQLALVAGFLPSFLLSGFLFEINSMPVVIQWITVIIPARYYIPALQSVFLAGDIWPLYLRSIAVLLFEGAVLFTLAARLSRKRLV
ncbi:MULTISPECIES: ABC transporter permease [unclassified Inquilinus]|uniref:ABC transporter permease n=1 Tax=unclassified Inquilinus TaxID=2645927 RepID=UPI003F90B3B5